MGQTQKQNVKGLISDDGEVRNAVGIAVAGTAIIILLIQAYRGNLTTPMIISNIGLLLIAGVFIVGGGAFTKLFKNWLNR